MDMIHKEIQEDMELRNMRSFTEWLKWYADWAGSSWGDKGIPDSARIVDAPELEMRSAVEFIRPELTPVQLDVLKEWDKKFTALRNAGIFYRNYELGCLYHCEWKREREDAAKYLGRTIPFTHWWYWPPELN